MEHGCFDAELKSITPEKLEIAADNFRRMLLGDDIDATDDNVARIGRLLDRRGAI